MRVFAGTVFDEIVQNTSPVYTEPRFDAPLAKGDRLALQVIANQLGTGVLRLSVAVEYSHDGRNWAELGAAIDRQTLSSTTTNVLQGSADLITRGGPCAVRLRIVLDDGGLVSVRIRVCGRAKQTAAMADAHDALESPHAEGKGACCDSCKSGKGSCGAAGKTGAGADCDNPPCQIPCCTDDPATWQAGCVFCEEPGGGSNGGGGNNGGGNGGTGGGSLPCCSAGLPPGTDCTPCGPPLIEQILTNTFDDWKKKVGAPPGPLEGTPFDKMGHPGVQTVCHDPPSGFGTTEINGKSVPNYVVKQICDSICLDDPSYCNAPPPHPDQTGECWSTGQPGVGFNFCGGDPTGTAKFAGAYKCLSKEWEVNPACDPRCYQFGEYICEWEGSNHPVAKAYCEGGVNVGQCKPTYPNHWDNPACWQQNPYIDQFLCGGFSGGNPNCWSGNAVGIGQNECVSDKLECWENDEVGTGKYICFPGTDNPIGPEGPPQIKKPGSNKPVIKKPGSNKPVKAIPENPGGGYGEWKPALAFPVQNGPFDTCATCDFGFDCCQCEETPTALHVNLCLPVGNAAYNKCLSLNPGQFEACHKCKLQALVKRFGMLTNPATGSKYKC